jgi:murein DD-endopeptidase MepM/ murein hydrolase activator NlpD
MSMSSLGRGHLAPMEGSSVVRKVLGGRRVHAGVAAFVVSASGLTAIAPGAGSVPVQEDPSEDASSTDDAIVAIDVDVADGDAVALTGALDEMQANVGEQLRQLETAEATVRAELDKLAAADAAITVTQGQIDELTTASDSVVVTRFMNPPTETAIEALTADSVADATVKQALLDMRTEEDAEELSRLTAARQQLEEQQAHQEEVKAQADAARQEAEAALADLQAAAGQEAQFISDVRAWMTDPEGAARMAQQSPEAAAHVESVRNELQAKLDEIEQAEAAAEAARQLEEARQRELQGGFICPLVPPMSFTDTWGAARSGGRSHKGTDMMAARGTEVIAPSNGRVVHSSNSLGGMSFHLYADDGHSYYGTHLDSYMNVGIGHVTAGTPIGRVGTSGNAPDNLPHLHFEYHPNGGAAVNPYSRLAEVCDRS